MRRIRMAGMALVASVALGAIASGTASAGPPKLWLTNQNTHARYSGPVYNLFFFYSIGPGNANCSKANEGEVNGGKAVLHDKLGAEVLFAAGCSSKYSISGDFRQLALEWTGQVRTTGKAGVTITGPGPCAYGFSHLATKLLSIPGYSVTEIAASATGWIKKGSNLSCPPTEKMEWYDAITETEETFPESNAYFYWMTELAT
jgi:hypothetical protein